MNTQALLEATENIIQSNDIPNQPQIVLDLNKEMSKSEPEFRTISELVGRDIGLTLKVIRIANAPFWGIRREINSIHTALVILGLKNFKNLILTSSLKNVLKNDTISDKQYDKFYSHSVKTAGLSRFLADNILFKDNERVDKEHAYLVGLLHDCGIMIMAKKFQGYYDEMVASLTNGNDPTEIETSHYQTNHCMVGGLLTKNWNLPQSLIEPILYHHNPKFDVCDDKQTVKLSAILKLAEHIIANQPDNGVLDLLYNCEISSEDKLAELLSFADLNSDSYQELESISSDLMPVL